MLIDVYVASPDPDPNPRGGGQLPNPNECNSTLTSGTNNIYPYPYIDVNGLGSPLTNYPHALNSARGYSIRGIYLPIVLLT